MDLQRFAAPNAGPFYLRHLGGLASVVLGSLSFLAAFWIQFGGGHPITQVTEPALTLPLFFLATAAGVASFVRRERLRALPVVGMALALAAPIVGWLVLVAAVGCVALIALLIVAKLH